MSKPTGFEIDEDELDVDATGVIFMRRGIVSLMEDKEESARDEFNKRRGTYTDIYKPATWIAKCMWWGDNGNMDINDRM